MQCTSWRSASTSHCQSGCIIIYTRLHKPRSKQMSDNLRQSQIHWLHFIFTFRSIVSAKCRHPHPTVDLVAETYKYGFTIVEADRLMVNIHIRLSIWLHKHTGTAPQSWRQTDEWQSTTILIPFVQISFWRYDQWYHPTFACTLSRVPPISYLSIPF